MRKVASSVFIVVCFVVLASFAVHKFYMGIYQINYAPDKKMLEITTRIFVDDLNSALEKKYHKKTQLGTKMESAEDIVLMRKYLTEKFYLKVNGVSLPMIYLSKEMESDVLICYLSIKNITKFKTLEIHNEILTDYDEEQQNIAHFTGFGPKQSFLFTESITNHVLKF